MTYPYHTKPYDHQRRECEEHGEARGRGLFWEMGVGKSHPIINQAAALHDAGAINGLLVVAPRGVHSNWTLDELPTHLAPERLERAALFAWPSSHTTQKAKRKMARLMAWDRGLPVLSMSYSGMMTQAGNRLVRAFLSRFDAMLVYDESQLVGKPGSKRTKRAMSLARLAPWTRVLSGTPVTNQPFDVFSQLKCLAPTAWDDIGCRTFAAFKSHFGVWEEGRKRAAGGGYTTYPKLVRYRNMDQLKGIVAQHATRLVKDDVLDLPPKLYTKRRFTLSSEAARAYQELRQDFIALLDGGGTVTAPLAITRALRLQQVASGYVPSDDDHERLLALGDGPNARVRCLMETLQEHRGRQTIVWAKYRHDFRLIADALRTAGITFVEYHGGVGEDAREDAKRDFQARKAEVFLANPQAAGMGLTLTAATVVIYHNTTYRYDLRRQSEDRAHRIGQEHPVLFVDIVAELPNGAPTIDSAILDALARKDRMAAYVLGDRMREWL